MDFSEYTGPSDEWIALERTFHPSSTADLTTEQLKVTTNKAREETAARDMIEQGAPPINPFPSFTSNAKTSRTTIQSNPAQPHNPNTRGSTLEARSYRPVGVAESKTLPVYIHPHGGGFLFGTLFFEDAVCSRIVATLVDQNTPIVVLNVNYRHTPEHKYPAAWNDAEDAFHWVHDHITEIGGDNANVLMGGISAGAWLTASTVLAQHLNTSPGLSSRPKIKGQVLMIPVLVHYECSELQVARLKHPKVSSWVTCRDAPILPLDRVKLFTRLLGIEGGKEREVDLRLNPGNVSLTPEKVGGLPPTTFGIAGRDPLRDEGLLFARLLSENGVPTKTNYFNGVPHGFRRYGEGLSVCKKWDEVMVEGIKWALSEPAAEPFVIHAF